MSHHNSGCCRHSGGICFSSRTKMVCWMLMIVVCLSLLGTNGGGRNGVGFVVLVSAQDDQQHHQQEQQEQRQEKSDDKDDQNDNEQDTSCVAPNILEECRSLLDHYITELHSLREQVRVLKQENEPKEGSLAQGMQGEGLGQKRIPQDPKELKRSSQRGNKERLNPRLREERMAELAQLIKEEGLEQ